MGLGCLLFGLTHFLSGVYVFEAPREPLCYVNATLSDTEECLQGHLGSSISNFKYLLIAAQVIMGIGR